MERQFSDESFRRTATMFLNGWISVSRDMFAVISARRKSRRPSITGLIKIVLPDMTGSTFLAGLIV